jgi:hypothetical protein
MPAKAFDVPHWGREESRLVGGYPVAGTRQRLDEAVIRTGTDENVTPYYL